MIKKIFTLFLLLAFCTTSVTLAVVPQNSSSATNDVFNNNYQNLNRTNNYRYVNGLNKYQDFNNPINPNNSSYLNTVTNYQDFNNPNNPMYLNTLTNYQNVNSANYLFESLSAIEQMYNGKENEVSGNILYQAGYEQFNPDVLNKTSATGKYGSQYKLSIGEKVNVLSYGESVDVMAMSGSNLVSPMTQAEVGSNGALFVSGIGMVKAENRTLGDVEKEINTLAKRKFTNMQIKLQIPSGNEFSVFVYGEVSKPGKVYIGNNSSILDALNAAGGVNKTGTLRSIKYNGKPIDLYNTLFLGNDNGITLKANDKIFVGKIGNTMAVKNGVVAPGIYEIKNGETVNDIIKYAGGLLITTQPDDITMVSFDKGLRQKSAKNIKWNVAQTTKLSNGDAIEFKETYNGVENIVTIQGNIKHPATYAYKEGMHLSDILKNENELLEETFITQGVIRRISGKDNTIETIPIFLKEFFAGMNDPVLQPRDVISIYKNTNSQFVDVYGAISMPKHIVYTEGLLLYDVLTGVQFVDSKFNEQQDNNQKEEDVKDVAYTTNNGTTMLVGAASSDSRVISAENIACEITSEDGSIQVYYLYDIMITSNKIKNIKLLPNDKVFFRTLRDNEFIKNVKVSGFVNHPGVFRFVEGKRLKDIILMADGLTEDADLRGIVYTRKSIRDKQIELSKKNSDRDIKLIEGRMASAYKASDKELQARSDMITMIKEEEKSFGQKYEGQIALNIETQDITKIKNIDNIAVQDGDEIYIPRMSKHVSIIGEVYNEQSFMHQGSRAGKYIKEVGGYTPNASRFRKYRVGVNGRAEKIRLLTRIQPGDTIVVPRRVAGNDWYTPILSVFSTLANLAVMGVAISKW